MKARGIFAIAAAAVLALASRVKGFFKADSYRGASERISNGRQAFYNVSAPKCHTQKKHYK